MKALVACLAAAIMLICLAFGADPPAEPKRDDHCWVRIVFGMDEAAATWDGTVTVENGRLLAIDEWGLEERDQLRRESFSWKITTGIPQARRVTYAEPTRGVLVKTTCDPATTLSVSTEQGEIRIRVEELVVGRPAKYLDNRVEVSRLGTESLVAETGTDDDFASIAVDDEGRRFVLWVAYDDTIKRDRLLVRCVDDPGRPMPEIDIGLECSSPHLFFHGGQLQAVWCSPGRDRDWNVYTGRLHEDAWKIEQLTTAAGSDIQLAASQGADGSLWLAWQSFRNGNGDIYARRLFGGQWSNEIAVETSPADQWHPAISIDRRGVAWLAWDSYQHGNYDVFLRRVALSGNAVSLGETTAVATTPDFEAHASVLAADDRVWVAYDAAGPNWGKDFKNGVTMDDGRYSEPLHASRRIELRALINGQLHAPADPLPQRLPPDRIHVIERKATAKPSRFHEYPQLERDGDGRLWLMFRMCRQGYCAHPPRGIDWRIHATTFTDQGWLEPIELPRSQGRQNQRVAAAPGPDGRLQCAWADGNRFASVGRKYAVHYGALPSVAERPAPIPLETAEAGDPGLSEPEPVVDLTIERGDDRFFVFFGDLHRHTNISRCMPTIDGSLDDAHRYALDAVEYDFLAVTDHTRDVDPFSWWRTQKAVDQFSIPGRYVPIYGYERSNASAGGGHRNVFFLERGNEINPSEHWYQGRNLPKQDSNPDTTLYPWMKQRQSLTAAHTPEYSKSAMRGTWTYNDPQLEPVAEIFQGFRRDYERPGPGVAEQVSLWHALRQGHRLGFIASSDHMSTHMSFACVWAREKTRESIFEGIAARRTYAATDRIGLDVRIGDAVMGEEIDLDADVVRTEITAIGTAPFVKGELIRSGEVIVNFVPEANRRLSTIIEDSNPKSGTSYYYVRLLQQDGGIAWGSPIWVIR